MKWNIMHILSLQIDWFSLALFSSTIASIVGILQKTAIKTAVDPAAFGIYFQFLVGIFGIPIAIINKGTFSLDFTTVLLLIIMAFFSSCGNLLYYFALKSVEISQACILTTTSSIWLLFEGLIFFGEQLTFYKASGVILILMGVMVIYINKHSFSGFGTPQILLLISAFFSGMTGILDKHLIASLPVSYYQVLSYLLQAAMTAILIPDSIKSVGILFNSKKTNYIIILSAILLNLGIYSYFTSLKIGGEISKINPILQASTMLTVFLGIVFLNERRDLFKKFLGASIIFSGILLIK